MSIAEFLSHLRNVDIELRYENNRLLCNAPKGAITDEIRNSLSQRKEDIILFLKQAESSAISYRPDLVPISRDQKLPTSFAQQRVCYLELLEPNTSVFNIPTAYRLRGKLDKIALHNSLNEIIRRHEVMRTTFAWEGAIALQIIAPSLTLDLPEIDYSHLTPELQEEALENFFLAEQKKPFDLENGPLVRSRLIKLNNDDYCWFFMIHHTIWDGGSFDIFLHELTTLYKCFKLHQSSPLPDMPVQYADYAAWCREWIQGDNLSKQLKYWKNKLSGELPVLNMPADRPRSSSMSYAGKTQLMTFPAAIVDKLEAFGRAENATLYMVMLAAFKVLLYRYSGQNDICVGVPIQSRLSPQVENLIGFFVNTLVLRSGINPSISFRNFLNAVRTTCLEGYSNQDIPFEKLIEEINPQRIMSHTPFYQAMFTLEDISKHHTRLDDIPMEHIFVKRPVAATDLTL
jgi:hypothetical protein